MSTFNSSQPGARSAVSSRLGFAVIRLWTPDNFLLIGGTVLTIIGSTGAAGLPRGLDLQAVYKDAGRTKEAGHLRNRRIANIHFRNGSGDESN